MKSGDSGRKGAPGPDCTNDMRKLQDEVSNIRASLMAVHCGIYSTRWRRVAHFDMTDPKADKCPDILMTFSNAINQRIRRIDFLIAHAISNIATALGPTLTCVVK